MHVYMCVGTGMYACICIGPILAGIARWDARLCMCVYTINVRLNIEYSVPDRPK